MKQAPSFMRRASLALICAALAACSTIPPYQRPEVAVPAQFSSAPGWSIAAPTDQAPRGPWWTLFQDPQLDELEAQVDVSNQSLKKAVSQLQQARAMFDYQQAGFWPTVTAGLSQSRARTSQNVQGKSLAGKTVPDYSAGVSASWEPDLFGRIHDAAVNAQANADATQADVEAVRLSITSQLAVDYFNLRSLDMQKKLLDDSVVAYDAALRLLNQQLVNGAIDASAVAQARAQLESTRTQATETASQRAQLEHAIATLVGQPASTFKIATHVQQLKLPTVPSALPSQLLERRPDIAAAERRVFAANAQIGEARAAFFPSLTLGVSAGLESTFYAPWLTAPSLFWSLGPQLAGTLFDGGRHHAMLASARAQYDGSVADYRQTVLTSFQQVEDNLTSLGALSDEARSQRHASDAAALSLKLTTNRYQAGAVSYLDVVTAQTIALDNERTAEQIDARRAIASVGLLVSLGGDWQQAAKSSGQ
ncbi:efflux transporter outer membrane subunit [Caballeronia humi]|uniref:RND transporter n=1 Tax=Caballeronia humi TaxID=326474 RepID=A0A158HSU0_9BURK|nr:efflux transporter outer membrane subunit [Caballeronia humi]SAL47039.1 RND transporter [Caballeronia humi]